MKKIRFVSVLTAAVFLTLACQDVDPAGLTPNDDDLLIDDGTWPTDMGAVLSTAFTDPAGDQEALPPEMAGPPYSGPVPFPAIDVTQIGVGVDGDYLYMRVDFAGAIPTAPVHIQASGEVEEQWVNNQGMNIALNVDDDVGTGGGGEGVAGIDIFFAVSFDYGERHQVYANWEFPDGDVHHNVYQLDGELGVGGAGHDYVIVRYDVSNLGSYFPRGQTVDIGSWSEAESFDASGALKYHHFAFDRTIDGGRWTIP